VKPRRIACICERTLGNDGPRTTPYVAGKAFTNRTHGGPPAFYVRADDGTRGEWIDGVAPGKCGDIYEETST
jgi:hypothetical protein